MQHPLEPHFERRQPSRAANRDAVLTLVAVALILATLWSVVWALAVLFDPYIGARPAYRPPLVSPSNWIDPPGGVRVG